MLLDAETLRKSAEMHPQVIEFATANPQPPLDWSDWQAVRAGLAMVGQQQMEMLGPAELGINESYQEIPLRDGFKSKIKIVKPADPPSGGGPLIVSLFGGGWISGDLEFGSAFARAYVRAFGATVVLPSYRLSPQHKFPVPPQDACDSIKWLDEHAAEIGADPSKGFIVSGVSAGGTSTAVCVAHSLEEKLKHPITGQYLCVPSIMHPDHVPEKYKPYFLSHEHNKAAKILSTVSVEQIAEHTGTDAQSTWRYPILFKTPLSAQPPAYFQVDGLDPLRDEALIWDEMLKEAGVKTKVDFYPGCPHAHFGFMLGIEVTTRAIGDALVGVGWLLGKEITHEQGLGAMVSAS